MSSLIAHLAYARIDRSRLFVAYAVGLAVGAILAALVLVAVGVLTIP
jgi:hypothetical protein